MTRVYYATNREFSLRRGEPNFGNGFHHDSPHNLRFGWAEVEPRNDDDYVVRSVHVAEDPTRLSENSLLVAQFMQIHLEIRPNCKDK